MNIGQAGGTPDARPGADLPPGPVLLWIRRELRLADHPALTAALATGRPVVAVFILDPLMAAMGAAPRWRLGLGLARFAQTLDALGGRLVLRRGDAAAVLAALLAETGAGAVFWTRAYDAPAVARDTAIKAALRAQGVVARSFAGNLLFEPMTVLTGQGGPYRVFTPYWNAVRNRPVPPADAPPAFWPAPARWPAGEALEGWALGAAMNRGGPVVAAHAVVGEAAAAGRLADFVAGPVAAYRAARDYPARHATSGLSENLTWGEIGPRTVWHAAMAAMTADAGAVQGAEHFLRELAWREFSWHLLHHTPQIATANWRSEWDGFAWRPDNPDAEAWRRGMTGEPMVDAAMRQMYVTGTMHNRARMIAASYLTKHLLTDWRVGQAWFAECLIDWDPAANALGWQWVAGSGPDAAPYFRIFNPATQAETWDPDAAYRRAWLTQPYGPDAGPGAHDYFRAVPRRWGLDPAAPAPAPRIGLAAGRARALAAYAARPAA